MTATALHTQTMVHFSRKRMAALALPVIVLAYFVYIFFAFDIPGLGDRINVGNARTLLADAYSYKTHVTQDNRDGAFSIAIEGERKGAYEAGTAPDWVTLGIAPSRIWGRAYRDLWPAGQL